MRLLAAGLLVCALLLMPTASATDVTLGLSGASAVVDLTSSPVQYVPITVSFHITSGYVCQSAGSAKVKVVVQNSTGPITAALNATELTFSVPATFDQNNPTATPQDFNAQKSLNLTLTRTGAGNGTAAIVATFDGNVAGCQAGPDTSTTPPSPTGTFTTAYKSLNVTTQSLTGTPPSTSTPVSSTPVSSTPVSSTPSSSTPVSSSPVDTTPTDATPAEGKKSFLPGPSVPLVMAGLVAVAMLLRRVK